ncbi:MAG: Calx-beta domain-containing protein [Mycobacterium sp.]
MRASLFIGRVGGLAVALGVGAAAAGGPGLAWAAPEDSAPSQESTSAAGAPGGDRSDAVASPRKRAGRGEARGPRAARQPARAAAAERTRSGAVSGVPRAGRHPGNESVARSGFLRPEDLPAVVPPGGFEAVPVPAAAVPVRAAATALPAGTVTVGTANAGGSGQSGSAPAAATQAGAGRLSTMARAGALQSVLGPLLGTDPSAPGQSPVSWMVLAAARRQGERLQRAVPAATTTGQAGPAPAAVYEPNAPIVTISDVIFTEGNGTTMTFVVSLDKPLTDDLQPFKFWFENGTAKQGVFCPQSCPQGVVPSATADFMDAGDGTGTGSSAFRIYTKENPGEFFIGSAGLPKRVRAASAQPMIPDLTQFQITVWVRDDQLVEGNENFRVVVANGYKDVSYVKPGQSDENPKGPWQISALGTIKDNDKPVATLTGPATVTEGGKATYTVSLAQPNGAKLDTTYEAASVSFSAAGSSPSGAKAATAGSDFTPGGGRVDIPKGSTQATFEITASSDNATEGPEAFTVTLQQPTTGATLGTAKAVSTVITDVPPPPTPPVPPGGTVVTPFGTPIDPARPGRTRFEYRNNYAFAVLLADGTVTSWGNPKSGGTPPAGLTGVKQIYSSGSAFAALKKDGTVLAWGDPAKGGTTPAGLSNVKQIYSNGGAFAALTNDGKVVAWGDPAMGGNNQVPSGLSNVKQIYSNGGAFAALTNDNKVFAWGDPVYGGDGKVPAGLANVKDIYSTEYAFAALKNDNTVSAWGDPRYGGDTAGQKLADVKTIYATKYAFAALTNAGSVLPWGSEFQGGNLTRGGAGTATPGLLANVKVVKIVSTTSAFAALTDKKSVIVWGDPNVGGFAPTGTPRPELASGVKDIVSNSYAFAALKDDGTVVAWGDSAAGGATPAGLSGVKEIVSTSLAFAALTEGGKVTAWGDQTYGGNNEVPSGLSGVVRIFSSAGAFAALTGAGAVRSWGDAGYGGGGSWTPVGSTQVAVSAADPFRDDQYGSATPSLPVVTLAGPTGPVSEGGKATLTVKLPDGVKAGAGVTVSYETVDGKATAAGKDYTAVKGSVPFVQGANSATFSVDVLADQLAEPTEAFTVRLTGATGATVAAGQGAQASVSVRDAAPSVVSLSGPGAVEEGKPAVFKVGLPTGVSAGEDLAVTYQIAEGGTAKAGADFTAPSGTVTIKGGQNSATFNVETLKDAVVDKDEFFNVKLTGAGLGASVNPAVVKATITDVTPPLPTVTLTGPTGPVSEGNPGDPTTNKAVFTVKLPDGVKAGEGGVTVNYQTSSPPLGATANVDYTAVPKGAVTISKDANSATFSVDVLPDREFELDEVFVVTLTGATGATLGNSGKTATATIKNDDPIITVVRIPVGQGPSAVAVNRTNTRVYVSNGTGGDITVIDATSPSYATTTIPQVGGSLHGIAVSPDGNRVFVASTAAFEGGGAKLSVYDANTKSLLRTVSFGDYEYPWGVAADATRVYVTSPWSGTVLSLDTTKDYQVTRIPIGDGSGPQAVVVTESGKVYVANNNGTVSVIANNAVSKTLSVGGLPTGFLPDAGGKLRVFNAAGQLTTVNTADDSFVTEPWNEPFPGLPNAAITSDYEVVYTPNYLANEVWRIAEEMVPSPASSSV